MTAAIECSSRKFDGKDHGADWIHNTAAYRRKVFKILILYSENQKVFKAVLKEPFISSSCRVEISENQTQNVILSLAR